jgi:copper transport protein
VLKTAPARVSLRFDEHVSTPFGAVRVLDANGRRVDNGRESQPQADTVAVGLPSFLADGTYVVAWRVISADTHPVHARSRSPSAGSRRMRTASLPAC